MKAERWAGWLIFILNRQDMTVCLTLVFRLNFLFNVILMHSLPCIKLRNCIAGSLNPMAIRKTLFPTNYKLEALWFWCFHKSLYLALPRSSSPVKEKGGGAGFKVIVNLMLSGVFTFFHTTSTMTTVITHNGRPPYIKAYRQKKTLEIHSLGLYP